MLTIGEVAARGGATVATLRHYGQRGETLRHSGRSLLSATPCTGISAVLSERKRLHADGDRTTCPAANPQP